MTYPVIRNEKYDFAGQSYTTQLAKYPAAMIPQLGSQILLELGIKGSLLDPYCGSGSSFIAALEVGIKKMCGYDLNPLAILISKAKYTKIEPEFLHYCEKQLIKTRYGNTSHPVPVLPELTNKEFWFSEDVLNKLGIIKHYIDSILDEHVRMFFHVPFSETVRECSYTRNSEFKLYRMKKEDMLNFSPDVFGMFFKKLMQAINVYEKHYFPLLNKTKIKIMQETFVAGKDKYEVVLTSPPYGDSKTTVAYGQFSTLQNEWLGFSDARRLDKNLMGGKNSILYDSGLMAAPIQLIHQQSPARALEVSSYYYDLSASIKEVSLNIQCGGFSIYVVGNRTVKGVQLPTDQFIAEQFVNNGLTHVLTYERLLSNKTMPSSNSPSNVAGIIQKTMGSEYIVVCKKLKN